MYVTERPGEEMEVEPVAALRVTAVGTRREFTHRGAIDRPAVDPHPLANSGEGRPRPRIEFAPGGWADVEEQVPTFRDAVDHELDEHLGRFPIEVVTVVSPTAVEGLTCLPDHRLTVRRHPTAWLPLLGRGQIPGLRKIETIVEKYVRLELANHRVELFRLPI